MNTGKRTYWLIAESRSGMARQYSKAPPERHPNPKTDYIWIPRSIVEHTSKMGDQHILTLPDWFLEKNGL